MATKKVNSSKPTTTRATNGKSPAKASSRDKAKSGASATLASKAAAKASSRVKTSAATRPSAPAVARKAVKKKASATPSAPVPAKKPAAAKRSSGVLDVGDSAPSFVLRDQTGAVVSSESLRGAPYVIYFYPKDDTPGCTLEACGFRDSMPRFAAKGVRIVGVSPDSSEVHARFDKKYSLSFPLLSDPEKTLAKAYGVWTTKKNYGREYMGVERSTFYVDRAGVIRKVWRGVRVPGHVDEVVHSV